MTTTARLTVDEDQRNIFRNSLGSSLTAEAGAGTGKTSLLVDRLIGLAVHHGDSLKQIVAITYTEKAAAELFDRARQGLEMKLASSVSPEEIFRYSKILSDIETANISTIHGLASSIVHDRAIQAGIDPEFAHIDPLDEDKLVRDTIFSSLKAPDEQRDIWLSRFVSLGGKMNSLLDISYGMFEKRHILNDSILQNDSLDYHDIVTKLIDNILKLLKFAENFCTDQSDRGFLNIASVSSTIPSEWDQQPDLIFKWLTQVSSLPKNAGVQKNWNPKESLKTFKADISSVKEKAEDILASLRRETIENILIWLKSVVNEVQRIKLYQGKIGFADQLSMAHELLKSTETREEFANRYQCLLIDEFQDTDPLQVEIALYLSAVKSADTSAYDLTLEPGKLSVVGDPKQSIYRFRGADIETYKHASELIVKTGKPIHISQNFRSSIGIIEFVNAFFGSIWSGIDSRGFTYTPIAPDSERPQPSPEPCVTVLMPNDEKFEDKQKVDDLRIAEARAIAHTIQNAQQDPNWTVCDSRRRELRGANYSDFALLFPRTTSIDIYTKVFSQYGIPFQIEGGKNFFHSQIATEFHSCMSAIDNPADRLSLIAALRSRFFAISDREIFSWQKANKGVMDYRNISEETSKAIKPALKTLDQLHKSRNNIPADQLIDKFLKLTKAIPQLLSNSNSWSDVAAIERFQEHAYSWSRDNGIGLRGFCSYLSNLIEAGDDKGSGGSSRSRDAVKLMTIHAAKGLEFPIVALANFFGPKSNSPPIISRFEDKLFEVRLGSQTNGYFETSNYSSLLGSHRQAEVEENLRLMYVAMTRARDHLIIPKFVETDKEGNTKGLYHTWLDNFLNEDNRLSADEDELWNNVIIPDDNTHDIISDAHSNDGVKVNTKIALNVLNKWQVERDNRLKMAIERIPKRIAPSKLVPEPDSGSILKVTSSVKRTDRLSIGNAFHNYMAKCSLSTQIDNELAALCALEYKIELAQLSPLITNCLSNPIWHEVINSRRNWRELPVSAKLNGVKIRGIIDAVFQDSLGLYHIIDFKTGALNLKDHHPQLRLYADSLRASIGKSVSSARLYYAESGKTENVPLPDYEQ